ncbi:ABC transporter permease subunit [Bradyrhizobium sp. RDT10]
MVFVICLGFYITPQALGGLRDAMLSTFIAAQVETAFNLESIAATAFILLGIAALVLSTFGLDISGKDALAAQSTRKSWFRGLPSFGTLTRYLNELATPYRAKRWTANVYQAGRESLAWKVVGAVFVVLVLSYLLSPCFVVVMMSFSPGASLEFPPSSFSLQWYRSFFNDPTWTGAAWMSIQIGIAVAVLSAIIGTLAAYGFSRTFPRLRSFLTMVVLAPITFPVIVVGVAVYLGFVSFRLLDTVPGIVLAHSIGSMSYVVVIVSATLANFDRRLEQAAMSMRAGPAQTFIRVTLPLIRPGIIGGAVFAFIHSFDEVVITSLVSGFSIRTLPLKMWEDMRHQLDPTIAAVASLLMLLPILWLITLYATWWRSRPKARLALPDPGT